MFLSTIILLDFYHSTDFLLFYYKKDLGVLRVLSCDASTPRRSAMLQEMHFRNISQRANLRKRTEEAARYLEATRYYKENILLFKYEIP